MLAESSGGEELVNDLSEDCCTALYYAVLGGYIDIVHVLIQRGGKTTIDSADNFGATALHNAGMCGLLYVF